MAYEFNKEDYKELKQLAKLMNRVKILSFSYEDEYYSQEYNGVTIAYAPVFPGSKMLKVATSFCASDDKFKKKIGKFHALDRFFSGELMQLPLGHKSDRELEILFEDMFYS